MDTVFSNHIVICGWNSRGRTIVRALQTLSKRPIVIVHDSAQEVLRDIESLNNVYTIVGDCSQQEVLVSVDVAVAHSVLVLAVERLGFAADARSVEVALAVEKIETSVYTVVEVRDLRNKAHFSWTKVDDLVADQEVAVCMIAQGVRHIMSPETEDEASAQQLAKERQLLKVYSQLVSPFQSKSQLFSVRLNWNKVKTMTFAQILKAGVGIRVLPLALVGYRVHKLSSTYSANGRSKVSWKSDKVSNPAHNKSMIEIWPDWPSPDYPLGVLVMATSEEDAQNLATALQSL